MKKIICLTFFLLIAIVSIGCTAKDVQKSKPIATDQEAQKSKSIPLTPDITQSPDTDKDVQQIEGRLGMTETFPCKVSKLRECVLKVIQERGGAAISPEEQKDVIATGFWRVTEEELKRIAHLPTQDRIRWTKGMYNLLITVSPGTEGSANLTLSVRILGYGETSLPLMRPTPWWPLSSKGVVEQEFLASISRCCQKEVK